MSRTKKQGRSDIAKYGRREAVRRQLDSVAAVKAAMREIEREIETNGGIYPLNNGRLTLQELLRRAKKSSAYLEKKSPPIVALKRDVSVWLALANGRMITGAKNIRREVTARVGQASDEVKAIRQAWAEAELEFAEAEKTIDKLKQENASLQRRLSDGKIVPLGRGRTK